MRLSENAEHLNETCILCEERKEQGIYIVKSFLCKECERELIQLDPEHPKYKSYVIKLRKLKAATLYS